jgi:phosphate transport system permease protein
MICGVFSITTTIGILVVLFGQSTLILNNPEFSLVEFFTSTTWQPQSGQFGILPLATATFVTSLIAMVVAVPLGLGAAIYLSEYAKPRARAFLKPILEILAGVPTVVYGFFALQTVSPFLRGIFGQDIIQFQNMASAGLVMGFMILPTITSVSEDALSAVPRSLREASFGLGATRLETSLKVVVPAALSGIVAAFILGISRAVGETMIVALAAGAGPKFTANPFQAAETMTGHIVRISGGELSYNSIEYNSLFMIGLALFFITLLLNLISQAVIRRYRETYQ